MTREQEQAMGMMRILHEVYTAHIDKGIDHVEMFDRAMARIDVVETASKDMTVAKEYLIEAMMTFSILFPDTRG